ncbi:YncE family protein [Pontibacter virosus]|uniref:YVTN family beta-propeller protein n=1 Tax=Pontibacter virosus TaxID=1765052 RepID=A0A2U1B514_9BACT|nr:YncE family protein [Pontibacter virosus]PVY43691.1 YVTN family beta-propeller protein [Pontibacter virosus]
MVKFKSFICVVALAVGLTSCNKDEEHDEHEVALNIDYPAAYVVNGQDNNVSVIKLEDNQITETVALKDALAPHHISLSPDKSLLAVAITSTDLSGGHGGAHGNGSSFKVTILDAVTGLTKKTIDLPKMPHNAAFNAEGTELWIGQAESNSGTVAVYSTSDWTLKNTIPVGKGPSEVTFSSNGDLAFVANTGAATVSVIDPVNKLVKKTLGVGEDPVGAWPATNGKMYVDNETSQTVSVIDVATESVTETLALGFKPGYVAFQDKTNELWVSDATNGKVIIYQQDGATWAKKAEVLTGNDAHAIAFNAERSLAYITNQGANTVTVLDATTFGKIKELSVGRMPNGIVIRQ